MTTTTTLGPLTTAFSPPAGCLGPFTWQLPNPGRTDSYFLQGKPSVASCFPENYNPYTAAYYSPGVCPSEYTAVRNEPGVSSSPAGVLTCCPTYASFTARPTSYDVPFMKSMACQSFFGISGAFRATIMSGSVPVTTTVTYTESDVLNAYGVVIIPTTPAPSSQSSATSTATQTTTPGPSQQPSRAPSSNALSTAAKGGIFGGIAALLLIALGGVWIFFARRKRKHTALKSPSNDSLAYNRDFKTRYAHEAVHGQSELAAGREAWELPASKHVGELPTKKETHELPA